MYFKSLLFCKPTVNSNFKVNDASHDFDKIKQEGCDYDKEKVLNIDVDKILGLKGNSDVREEVDSVASEFEFTKEY